MKALSDIVAANDRAILKRNGGKITEESGIGILFIALPAATRCKTSRWLGLSRFVLLVRANEHEELRRQLGAGQEMGVWARLENAEDAIWGGDLSTGSVERDKAVADFAKS